MGKQTHWICVNQVMSQAVISRLEHASSLLLRSDTSDLDVYNSFYGAMPFLCDTLEKIKRKLYPKIECAEKVFLLLPIKKDEPLEEHLTALDVPFIKVAQMYSEKGIEWHDKKVFHDFLEGNFQELIVPDRVVVQEEGVIDAIAESLRLNARVVVQCDYSRGGMNSSIYDEKEFRELLAGKRELPFPYKNGGSYLITPFYEHLSLSHTAVLSDGVELMPLRYQHIEELAFQGSSACNDSSLQERVTTITQSLVRVFQQEGYRGFLNIDLMYIDGSLFVSEINFRVPLSFFYELYLRENSGFSAIGYPQEGIRGDLYARTQKGVMHFFSRKNCYPARSLL